MEMYTILTTSLNGNYGLQKTHMLTVFGVNTLDPLYPETVSSFLGYSTVTTAFKLMLIKTGVLEIQIIQLPASRLKLWDQVLLSVYLTT